MSLKLLIRPASVLFLIISQSFKILSTAINVDRTIYKILISDKINQSAKKLKSSQSFIRHSPAYAQHVEKHLLIFNY
jgi:hypothetical protein